MNNFNIVGFSGNISRPSRTYSLVAAVLQEVASRNLGKIRQFDMVDVGLDFANALHVSQLSETADRVKSAIQQADALVVGSPIYKGAYTGLFKHFFDLFAPKSLAGKSVILVATGGSNRHALVIESHLRPLFSFFNAVSMPAGIFAIESDFEIRSDVTTSLQLRIREAVDQFERLTSLN